MKTLFGCAADDLAAMKFYEAAANNRLWQMDITDLHYISISTDTFPANMRQRATYWVNQKEGKHKGPTDKQREARKINWALHQLEGITGQLGALLRNFPKDSIWKHVSYNIAQAVVASKLASGDIRTINLRLTGKPPMSVRNELQFYKMDPLWQIPERLRLYLPKEKQNEQL